MIRRVSLRKFQNLIDQVGQAEKLMKGLGYQPQQDPEPSGSAPEGESV